VSPPDGPGATPGSKLIAPHSPNAPADNVAKAKETAKVAELTPIVPSPTNPLRPAFQLYAEVDLPVLGLGVVFASARLVRSQPSFCAPLCNRKDLNGLDRTTAGFWSPPWATASDVGLYGIAAAAATLLIADEGFLDAFNDSVVIAESALSATALASVISLAAGRPRPFLYGDKAPLRQRESPDAGLSFVSSHASVSFAIATSTFIASRRLHPASRVPYVVFGVGCVIASFVATARVMAGKHFITDSIAGATVGTAVGVLIPSLHASPVRIVPVVSDTQRGLGVSGVF
jgi:membrane-associated phospholipid phosphatase